jgi:hypothetical protein
MSDSMRFKTTFLKILDSFSTQQLIEGRGDLFFLFHLQRPSAFFNNFLSAFFLISESNPGLPDFY